MRGMLKLLLLSCCAVLSFVSMAHAKWTGPTEVVSTTFGSAEGQVGHVSGRYGGRFPKFFGVSLTGKIVVADSVNEKLIVFSSNGQFLRAMSRPVRWKMWPAEVIVGGECAVVGYVSITHTFDLSTGDLIGDAPNMGGADVVSDDCSKIYVWTEKNGKDIWRTYTPNGTVLAEVGKKPLELGRVEENYLGNGRYQSKVTYADKEWSFSGSSVPVRFKRDLAGNLYSNEESRVDRRDESGAVIATVTIPVNVGVTTPSGVPGVEDSTEYLEMYGDAYIAGNGDVYCWKKTPMTYSILKWTWQETTQ